MKTVISTYEKLRLQFLKASLEHQIRNCSYQVDSMNRFLSAMTPVQFKSEPETPTIKQKVSTDTSAIDNRTVPNFKQEKPSSEESKSLKSESEGENLMAEKKENRKFVGEDECRPDRMDEDSIATLRFSRSSEDTIVYHPEDIDMDEGRKGEKNEEKVESDKEDEMDANEELENLAEECLMEMEDEKVEKVEMKKVVESEGETNKESDAASQDIFDDIENDVEEKKKDGDSDNSQTLTADSKTPVVDNQSQSLLVSQELSETEALKRKLLDSSSSEDEDEEEEKSEEESENSSSSDLSSGEVLKKLSSSSKKRKKVISSNKQIVIKLTDEDKELNRLTNLSTLKRRLKFSSLEEDECEDDSGTWLKKQDEPKKEKKKKVKEKEISLLDMLDVSDESSKEENDCKEVECTDPLKQFWKANNDMLKEVVLASSGSSDSESTVTSDSMLSKKKKKSKKLSKGSDTTYRRPSWMNDPLLRGKLSKSDEEEEKIKKDEDSDVILESPDEKSKTEKPKKKKRKRVKDSDIESEDSITEIEEEEHISPVKSQETPSKGRKNIRKIFTKESLHYTTRQALDLEKKRKARIEERKKVYSELFPPSEDTLILDYDPISKKPLLKVDKKLVKHLKPHQREGVKFMWDSCFESLKKLEEESGSGCILAHCMGLGKTLQAITICHTLLTNNTGVHTILIVAPMNTVSNWRNEFKIWLRQLDKRISVSDLNDSKKHFQRSYKLLEWHENGGVMIISYDIFRVLTDLKKSPYKKYVNDYNKALLDPGPDLIICDEGHKIKTDTTAIAKCIRRIKTSRRVVLTGTPLQNNLNEYYWMVNFIKPHILGTFKEFKNRFLNPINNGQFKDSTAYDVNLMKKRSHVLHSLLDGCIQRYDYNVLTPFLPEKQEYVIYISLTKTQAKLYEYYLENFTKRNSGAVASTKIFKDYNVLLRVCTHPCTLKAHAAKAKEKEKKKNQNSKKPIENYFEAEVQEIDAVKKVLGIKDDVKEVQNGDAEKERLEFERNWWKDLVPEEEFEKLEASPKLILLFSILAKCDEIGEKVLLFSTSIYALNAIEFFLKQKNWIEDKDYFKLTGSTTSENRAKYCQLFNQKDNRRGRLFLISTKAGGLGINLVGANRVILFDVSWNPSNDVQSIFRVYRFGQTKTCYIYRFLAEATMEEKIYKRQVTKLSLADRVVDEHQIERHYTMENLQELYNYNPKPLEEKKTPDLPKDKLFADVLTRHNEIIVSYHYHDSLLENKEEEELTEEERQAAWEEFEKEKFYENKPPPPPVPVVGDAPKPQNLYEEIIQQAKLHEELNRAKLVNECSKMMTVFKNPMAQPNANGDGVSNIRIDKVESLSNRQ